MIRKRSITIRGHRTSLSLEDGFWQATLAIAERRGMPLAALIAEIDETRDPRDNLSSATRLYVLAWLKAGNRA